MSQVITRILDRIREPIVADRGLDLLAVGSWLCLAWWGISSTLVGIPSIEKAATPVYELLWGGTIGFLALVGAIAAFSTLFTIRGLTRIVKKQVELGAIVLMTGFASVYPTVVIAAAVNGDVDRTALSGLAIYLILFPIWRITHLVQRIRRLQREGHA